VPVVLKVVIAVSGGLCDYSLRVSINLATPLIVCEFCFLFVYPSAISSLIIFQYVSSPLLSGLSLYRWLGHARTVNYAHTAFVCVCSIVFLPQRNRLFPVHPTPHGIPNGNASCCLGGRNRIIICVRKVAKGEY